MDTLTKPISAPRRRTTADTVYPILLLVSVTHLLNDMMQSVIPAVYPLLKAKFGFSFAQIGLITLVFQMTSSILQPFVGRYADRHPRPYSLAAGMCFTLAGLFALALAPGFAPVPSRSPPLVPPDKNDLHMFPSGSHRCRLLFR